MKSSQIIEFHKTDKTTRKIKLIGIISIILLTFIILFSYSFKFSITIPCKMDDSIVISNRDFKIRLNLDIGYINHVKKGQQVYLWLRGKDTNKVVGEIIDISDSPIDDYYSLDLSGSIPLDLMPNLPLKLSKARIIIERKNLLSIIFLKK